MTIYLLICAGACLVGFFAAGHFLTKWWSVRVTTEKVKN